MSTNRVIGRGGHIPWHLPEDFKWFKRMTTGHILVMGRHTYEAIGKPLPGRTTLVLSRSLLSLPGVRILRSLDEIDPAAESREVFICGGAQVYREALPRCSDLYLTVVKQEVDGDAFFPPFEAFYELKSLLQSSDAFEIRHYRNSKF